MRILYVTAIGGTMDFFIDTIRTLIKDGCEVDLACNTSQSHLNDVFQIMGCKYFSLSCSRQLSIKEILRTIKEIQSIVKAGNYDIVHCHTPIAAACTRIACRRYRKKGLKVIYTAHGFHFYKGAPLLNWLTFYPIEWLCSFWTDTLITINKEDFSLAPKMHAKYIEYIPGVGVDLDSLSNKNVSDTDKRKELNIPDNARILLSVGNLNENKNHKTVIKAIAGLDVYYLIAGVGDKEGDLRREAKECGMDERVIILGYRTDIPELLNISEVFVFPSYREGLSVSLMEAMACGVPAVVSDIRGNRDLIIDKSNGFLCDPNKSLSFRYAISKLLENTQLRESMGKDSIQRIKPFSKQNVIPKLERIYKDSIR